MASRLELHEMLKTLAPNVYYQPPERMDYPAIKYELDGIDSIFADDSVYTQNHTYQVTVIDEDPDSEIMKAVSKIKYCHFNRHFTSDNLNHFVFVLNY